MSLPLARLPVVKQRFVDHDGAPLTNGYLLFYEAGTVTPLAVYADADGSTSLGSRVDLDDEGFAPSIYLANEGYQMKVFDENDVEQTNQSGDDIEDPGTVFVNTIGDQLAQGDKDVTDGYTVLATDLFVTVDSSSGSCVINLPPSADHPQPLCIKNMQGNTVDVTPNGAETIDGQAGVYTLPAAADPTYPSVWMVPTSSGWFIVASHGVV